MDNYCPILKVTTQDGVISRGGCDGSHRLFILVGFYEIYEIVGTSNKDMFPEYPYIAKDPVIGSTEMNWKEWIARTIAHELAHTLTVYDTYNKDVRDQVMPFYEHCITKDRRDHGLFWQSVYRTIVSEHLHSQDYTARDLLPKHRLKVIKERENGHEYITFKVGRRVACRYIRKGRCFWACNHRFQKPEPTPFKSLNELKRYLCYEPC